MEEKESLSVPPDAPQQRMRKRSPTFHCKDCGKCFPRAWALEQHPCVHPGDRAFSCARCHRRFNSKGNLQKHQCIKHKRKTGKDKEKNTANGSEKTEVNDNPESQNEPERRKETSNNNSPAQGTDKLKPGKKHSAKKDTENNNLSCACNKCGRRFSNKARLMTHLRFHEGKRIHRCLYCGNEFMSQSQLKIHEKIHTGGKPYKCDHCPKVFYILARLFTHTRKYHQDESQASEAQRQVFSCYECKKEFVSKRQLIQHHSLNHKKERYECKYCQQRFLYKWFLTEHEKSHKQNGDESHEDPSESSDSPDGATHGPNPKRPTCENCRKSFRNKTELHMHQLSHIGMEPFKCKYCTMDFCSEKVLELHERSHTGEQPYKCDYCGRWFAILGNLYGHIRTQHPNKELPEKERFESMKLPYLQSPSESSPQPPSNSTSPPPPQASSKSCPPPGTTPSSRSSPQTSPITAPKSTSQSSPQPPPKAAPKSSSQSSSQPSPKPPSLPPPQSPPPHLPLPPPVPHVLQIKLEFEKPYICEYCNKGFKTKHHLIEHRYIHIGKPFSCAVCGMGFIRQKKLELHQKSHTGRELFSCGECGYRFSSLQKLKTHKLKKHPDQAHMSNVYRCKYCDDAYSHYCSLLKHMKECDVKRSQDKHEDKEQTAEETGPLENSDSRKSRCPRAEKSLSCADCGAVVRLGFTTLSNVFAVTKVSNVKCFLKNHKMM